MLSAILRFFELPLLTKELIEMAARKRTYVMRTLAAAGLFLIALFAIADELRYRGHRGPMQLLGLGEQMVEAVIWSLMVGVYLLLPAVMCPAISAERESGTLTLLMISPLRPWQIVIQKLAARLVPVLSLLTLALPLMAVAYVYGGLEERVVYESAYIVGLAALQIGAIAIMCSAFFRTPGGALIATYVVLALISWLWPAIVYEFGYEFGFRGGGRHDALAALFCPPLMLESALYDWVDYGVFPHIGTWFSIVIALLLARLFVVSRANARPRNLMLAMFRGLDRVFKSMNRITGNRHVMADRRSLPLDAPVAWSELHRRAIGKVRYLFRLFIAIELPAALIALVIVYGAAYSYLYRGQFYELTVVLLILWSAYGVILTIVAAGLFATERSRQTLDVLLTTPMRTRDIVRQKLAGLTRLRLVLAAPILTLVLVEAWVESGRPGAVRYAVVSLIALWVYPSLMIWVAVWIGLRWRKPVRALIAALVVNTAIVVVPVLIGGVISVMMRHEDPGVQVAFLSPGFLVICNEIDAIDEAFRAEFIAAFVQLACWAVAVVALRFATINTADRMLGRVVGRSYPSLTVAAGAGA